MRTQCQEFATALLDHARTSMELEIMLNYNPLDLDVWDPGERQTLDRLKLAIRYKQKKVSLIVFLSKSFKLYSLNSL
jgi:transient receptor potential cation channel subfamily C member 4